MKVITEQCYNQDQSWHYQRVVKADGHTLKVDIRRNAYDHQSYARVERWSGTKWEHVWEEPITACFCRSVSYTSQNIPGECFEDDASALLSTALKILN